MPVSSLQYCHYFRLHSFLESSLQPLTSNNITPKEFGKPIVPKFGFFNGGNWSFVGIDIPTGQMSLAKRKPLI
jgi:hypothetical protein